MVMSAPSRAIWTATALPIPESPPVIITFRSANLLDPLYSMKPSGPSRRVDSDVGLRSFSRLYFVRVLLLGLND